MYDRPEIFHPMLVHFPIVLIIGSFAAMMAYAATRNEFFVRAAAWTVTLGAVAAIAAGIAGRVAAANAGHSTNAHEILVNFHEPLGYAVIGLTVLLTIWGFASKWKFKGVNLVAFVLALGLAVGAVSLTGHFGARMVYEEGMGINPKVLNPAIHEHSHEVLEEEELQELEKSGPGNHDADHDNHDMDTDHDGHSPGSADEHMPDNEEVDNPGQDDGHSPGHEHGHDH